MVQNKHYLVSQPSLKLSFEAAKNSCMKCFGLRLADIDNAFAHYGSPNGEKVSSNSTDLAFLTRSIGFGATMEVINMKI